MKKFLALLISVAMVFGLVAFPVSAEGEVSITVATVDDVQPGATVTLPITLEGDYSAHIITVDVNYDPANLTIAGPAKLRAGDLFPEDYADYGWATVKNVNNDTGVAKFGLMIAGDPSYPEEYQALSGNGTFLTIEFQVNENCNTNQPVTLTVREFKYMPLGQTSGTPIPYIVTNGAVNIEGAVDPTPAPTAEPTAVPTAVPTAEPTAVPPTQPPVEPTEPPVDVNEATITVGSALEVEGNTEVTIPVTVEGNYMADTFNAVLTYDPNLVEVVSVTAGSVIPEGSYIVIDTETPGTIAFGIASYSESMT